MQDKLIYTASQRFADVTSLNPGFHPTSFKLSKLTKFWMFLLFMIIIYIGWIFKWHQCSLHHKTDFINIRFKTSISHEERPAWYIEKSISDFVNHVLQEKQEKLTYVKLRFVAD